MGEVEEDRRVEEGERSGRGVENREEVEEGG